MMLERTYIDCACGTETICVENWPEDKQIIMAFFNMGQGGNKRSWADRFRFIWQIIKTGYPFADMVIIDHEHAQKLIEFIQKSINENKI